MRCMIDQYRRHRGLTWDKLSEATGIRKATLFAYNRGTSAALRTEHIDALCTLFAVPVANLLIAEVVELPLAQDLRQKRDKHPTQEAQS